MSLSTKRFFTFLLTFVFAFFVGCASTPKQEGTGEYVDDTVITTKVKAAVFNEPSSKSAEINVASGDGWWAQTANRSRFA